MCMQTIDEALEKLSKSSFRRRFHLSPEDREYVDKVGMEAIRKHAEDFIRTRVAPKNPFNDGKQTPMHGHPVFKAQHACACCCRGCLNKWYKVPFDRAMTEDEINRVVNLLMAWIERDYKKRYLY